MKHRFVAGLLAACLISPAFAANGKLIAASPDEPLHRRTVLVCMAVFIGLHAYRRRLSKEERLLAAYLH